MASVRLSSRDKHTIAKNALAALKKQKLVENKTPPVNGKEMLDFLNNASIFRVFTDIQSLPSYQSAIKHVDKTVISGVREDDVATLLRYLQNPAKAPSPTTSEVTHVSISLMDDGKGTHKLNNSRFGYATARVELPMPFRSPIMFIGDKGKSTVLSINYRFFDAAGDRTLLEKAQACFLAMDDIESSMREEEKNLHSLLEAVSTTGQLLEVWPGAQTLFPEDVKSKLSKARLKSNTKTDRKKELKESLKASGVDISTLNKATLTSSLLGD